MVGKAREGVTPPGPAPDTPPKPPAHQEFGGTTGLGQALPSPCPIHTVHPDGAPASHPALVLRGDLTLGLQEPDRLDVSSALHRVRQPEQGDVHAQTGVDVAGEDDNTAHVQQPPAPGEIHVPRMDAVCSWLEWNFRSKGTLKLGRRQEAAGKVRHPHVSCWEGLRAKRTAMRVRLPRVPVPWVPTTGWPPPLEPFPPGPNTRAWKGRERLLCGRK
ncbi:uncharacterized protein LOC113245099 isoform X2 [Ursus arctos]|uniref:uncharacterized protein LOC113245099 isoform X2 n=1 Tax=Ursus arctos TaxID=9644 RepID=UPI0025481D5A|nr:uncharacterized protein LOC113245099 isoform X2 [Ursus arctos]